MALLGTRPESTTVNISIVQISQHDLAHLKNYGDLIYQLIPAVFSYKPRDLKHTTQPTQHKINRSIYLQLCYVAISNASNFDVSSMASIEPNALKLLFHPESKFYRRILPS